VRSNGNENLPINDRGIMSLQKPKSLNA